MATIHHLVFSILVICYHAWSQQVTYKSCQNIASDEMCTALKMHCKRNDYLQLNCAKTCGTCKGIPVHGGYSQWSSWGQCNQTCGLGARRRSRSCTNPPPENGGNCCCELGRATEVRACFIRKCPVDGNFSQWSNWSQCSQSCAGGTQRRSRTCTSPPPANGGRECRRLGRATEFLKCNTHKCPVDGRYTDWSAWSECNVTCGNGTQQRNRSCTNPPPANNGTSCRGSDKESRICTPKVCTKLSVIYDESCRDFSSGNSCTTWKDRQLCKSNTYVQGNCQRTCGICKIQGIPVHGGYSQWNSWGRCSKTCGLRDSYRSRSRTCTSPPPANGGNDCSGLGQPTELQRCSMPRCPVCKNSWGDRYCNRWWRYCGNQRYPRVSKNCKKTCSLC